MAAATAASPAMQTIWSTAISADDHGPLVTISTCLMLVAMFFFLGFRMVVRRPWVKLLGYDDVVTIIGSLVACGSSVAIFMAVHYGLGQHASDLPVGLTKRLAKAIFAGDMLSVVALACSKLAISLLVLRLASFTRHIIAARLLTVAICMWMIVAIGAMAIQSPSRETRRVGWIGVGAYSMALEVALFALPVFMVWGLQMRLSQKFTVIIGFAFRIPASMLALFRILSVITMLTDLSDTPDKRVDVAWEYANPTILTICEMHYSLMAATIPCMHLFLKYFETGYLGTTSDQIEPSGSRMKGYASQSDSYVLSSVRSRHMRPADNDVGERPGNGYGLLRPATCSVSLLGREGGTTSWRIHPEGIAEDASAASEGSEKIIVRQTVDVKYEIAAGAPAER